MHATFSPGYLDLVRTGRDGHPDDLYGTNHQHYDCASGASTLRAAGNSGPHIGFYGGVNYGYGYGGVGYEGGRWNNGVFAYNRTVNNFGGVSITNVYSQTVINNTNVTRTSFNGGTGGTTVQPTPQEQAAAHEQHVAPTAVQTQHQQTASTNRGLLATEN